MNVEVPVSVSPKHGETRHHGIQTTHGAEVEYTDMKGEVVYRGPGVSHSQSIVETWCEHCQDWVETNGVIGPLRYAAFHRDGDCQQKTPKS